MSSQHRVPMGFHHFITPNYMHLWNNSGIVLLDDFAGEGSRITEIKIRALKYGNRLHYDWDTTLLEKTATHIVVLGEYGRKLHHHTRQQEYTVDNWTIEFFSFDSWLTVSADVIGGRLLNRRN